MANQGGALKDTSSTSSTMEKKSPTTTEKPEMKAAESQEGMSALLQGATEDNKSSNPGNISHFADRAMDIAGRAKSTASNYAGNVSTMIDDHPRGSFFTGLGLGCLLGITVAALVRR